MRAAIAASVSIWLSARTARRAAPAADGGGGAPSAADSVKSHGEARIAVGAGARRRARRRTASIGAAARKTSTSTLSGGASGRGANGASPSPTPATHGDHAPFTRALSSSRTLNGASVSALNAGTKCVVPSAGQAGVSTMSASPSAHAPAAATARRHAGGTAAVTAAGGSPETAAQSPLVTGLPTFQPKTEKEFPDRRRTRREVR